jgi:hypothetical protein
MFLKNIKAISRFGQAMTTSLTGAITKEKTFQRY